MIADLILTGPSLVLFGLTCIGVGFVAALGLVLIVDRCCGEPE